MMFQVYWRSAMYKDAVEMFARAMTAFADPRTGADARRAYQEKGSHGFNLWLMNLQSQKAKSEYVSPVELAEFHAVNGDRGPTFALLEDGFRQRAPDMLWLQTDPAYDFLHSDPRYRDLIKRIGLPPAY
jgi:hypothetical protein